MIAYQFTVRPWRWLLAAVGLGWLAWEAGGMIARWWG